MPHCDVLGHAGRTLRLAQALRKALPGHRIEFAGRGHCREIIEEAGFGFHDVVEFLQGDWKEVEDKAKKHKDTVRDERIVGQFVEEELALFERLQPLAVIGDHRYSLFTSTQIARIPLIAITNAFYTRHSSLRLGTPKTLFPIYHHYPRLACLHPLVSWPLAPFIPAFIRRVSRLHCVPYDAVRKRFGLAPHQDFFDFYSGDQVLLPDLPDICPTRNLPANYHYVGLFGWSPETELPREIPEEKEVIYLTMGSTGRPEDFDTMLAGLRRFPEYTVVATLGPHIRPDALGPLPENFRVYPFLPGEKVLSKAAVALHHGGMGILGQCLKAGVPMVCIPGNVEQEVMARQFVQKNGLGLVVERYGLSPKKLENRVRQVLGIPEYADRVRSYARRLQNADPVASAAGKVQEFIRDDAFLEAVQKGVWKRP
jgi:UDP:flavonoid glycosyltransferase YjiC (YdhE family)